MGRGIHSYTQHINSTNKFVKQMFCDVAKENKKPMFDSCVLCMWRCINEWDGEEV